MPSQGKNGEGFVIKRLFASKIHLAFVVLFMIGIGGFIFLLSEGLKKAGTQIPGAQNGKPAQPFRSLWIQGEEHLSQKTGTHFELKDFKNRPIILNFWASWCFSCREEARDLEAVWQSVKNEGVLVVGIAIQDTVEDAKKFAKQYGKTYILGLDETGRSSIDYGITGVPESFFIDKNGIIIHKEARPLTKESLMKYAALLK